MHRYLTKEIKINNSKSAGIGCKTVLLDLGPSICNKG